MSKIIWNNFLGGLSSNERVGSEGSFHKGWGVNPHRKLGYLQNGPSVDEFADNNWLTSVVDVVMAGDWIFWVESDDNFKIDDLPTDQSGRSHSFSGSSSTSVFDMQVLVEKGSKKLYYAYETNGSVEIGKATADSLSLSSENDDWLTGSGSGDQGQSISGSDTLLAGFGEKLFIKDVNELDQYDALVDAYTTGRLVLPSEIVALDNSPNYLVALTTDNNIYIWDGFSDSSSANFDIPVGEDVMDIVVKDGTIYFATFKEGSASQPEQIIINRVSGNFSGYERLRELDVADVSTLPARYASNLVAGSDGIYFILKFDDNNNNNVEYYVFCWGSRAGQDESLICPVFTSQSYNSSVNSSKPIAPHILFDVPFQSTEGLFWFDILDSEPRLWEARLPDTDDTNATLQTTEKTISQPQKNYFNGRIHDVLIHYTGSSNSTDVKLVLDGSEVTVASGDSFSSGSRIKKYKLNSKKFDRDLAVKLEGGLPQIFKIEVFYEQVESYTK